jgi:hypothetical protein
MVRPSRPILAVVENNTRVTAMPIEAALVKPVVDALMGLFRQGHDLQLKHNAEAALREAIRELLLANPDENKAAARIAIAKAAGILSEDVVLAEDMLRRHRDTRTRTRGKGGSSRRRSADNAADAPSQSADAKPAKPSAKPKTAAKKSAKPATRKPGARD